MTGTHSANGPLEQVLERLEALERENAACRAETARLARELAELRPGEAARGAAGGQAASRLSRRGMLRLGAATGGVALAGGLVRPPQALAGADGDLALGSTVNSAVAPTGLSVSGSTAFGIGVSDNGFSPLPFDEPNAALLGRAHQPTFGAGVLGFSDNGQVGIAGTSQPGSSGPAGAGVHGKGNPGVLGEGQSGVGVDGLGGSGLAGVRGTGSPGVQGLSGSADETAIEATNAGTFQGTPAPANGIAVLAQNTFQSGGPPTASSVALVASNEGAGTGVKATSVSGTPIVASIVTPSNPSPAVSATTKGSGPALKAQTNGTGPALKAQVTNAASPVAAVVATGSQHGRGGVFSGGAAQVRLSPGGARPTSGQTGDLFVDSAGHLHYCQAGGSAATWVQLA